MSNQRLRVIKRLTQDSGYPRQCRASHPPPRRHHTTPLKWQAPMYSLGRAFTLGTKISPSPHTKVPYIANKSNFTTSGGARGLCDGSDTKICKLQKTPRVRRKTTKDNTDLSRHVSALKIHVTCNARQRNVSLTQRGFETRVARAARRGSPTRARTF